MTIRKNLMKGFSNQMALESLSRRTSASVRPLKSMLLGPILALLLLGHASGYDIWQPPPGQPEQMSSKVDYNPVLTDRFFKSDEWICPSGSEPETCRDGEPVLILSDPCDPLKPETCFELREWSCPDGCKECATCRHAKPVVKLAARCYATSWGVKHPVTLCEARLFDSHLIELLIHKRSPAFSDSLLVRISDGEFTCQYWIPYDFGAVRHTTTRQKLTLDKKAYQKGDIIKGRIDIEVLNELFQPMPQSPPEKIGFFGVFKTILK